MDKVRKHVLGASHHYKQLALALSTPSNSFEASSGKRIDELRILPFCLNSILADLLFGKADSLLNCTENYNYVHLRGHSEGTRWAPCLRLELYRGASVGVSQLERADSGETREMNLNVRAQRSICKRRQQNLAEVFVYVSNVLLALLFSVCRRYEEDPPVKPKFIRLSVVDAAGTNNWLLNILQERYLKKRK